MLIGAAEATAAVVGVEATAEEATEVAVVLGSAAARGASAGRFLTRPVLPRTRYKATVAAASAARARGKDAVKDKAGERAAKTAKTATATANNETDVSEDTTGGSEEGKAGETVEGASE